MHILKRASFILLAIAGLLLAFPTFATAWTRPIPEQVTQLKADGTWDSFVQSALASGNHLMDSRLVQRARFNLQNRTRPLDEGIEAPPPSWTSMKTRGTIKIFVLCIAFADSPFSNNANEI
ncbi:MAG: hypothetical protein AAB229_01055, partial [Candidatus Hydrogenedentota bacterium]